MEVVALTSRLGRSREPIVVVAERIAWMRGKLFVAMLDNPDIRSVRGVPRHTFDVTDSNLLLLERRFNLAESVGMHIRHIRDADIWPDTLGDGEIFLEADTGPTRPTI